MSEAVEQIKVVEWCKTTAYRLHGTTHYGVGLIIHIPNGGLRSRSEAARLKAMGVRSGVSDLFLPVPVPPHAGLWIEMKAQGGAVAPKQDEWLDLMRSSGYAAFVAVGADEAIALIKDYLGQK